MCKVQCTQNWVRRDPAGGGGVRLVQRFHFIRGAVGLAIHYLGHKRQPLKIWSGAGGIKAHVILLATFVMLFLVF